MLTIRVDDGENIEIVVIQKRLGKVVTRFVAVDELFGDVFKRLWRISVRTMTTPI